MNASPLPFLKPTPELVDLMLRVHRRFVAGLDLSRYADLPPDALRREIRDRVDQSCDEVCAVERIVLQPGNRNWLAEAVLDQSFGFGPLEPLLRDSQNDVIVIKSPRSVWVEREGHVVEAAIVFRDDRHVRQVLDETMGRVRRADQQCVVDGSGPDSRAIRIDVQRLKHAIARWDTDGG